MWLIHVMGRLWFVVVTLHVLLPPSPSQLSCRCLSPCSSYASGVSLTLGDLDCFLFLSIYILRTCSLSATPDSAHHRKVRVYAALFSDQHASTTGLRVKAHPPLWTFFYKVPHWNNTEAFLPFLRSFVLSSIVFHIIHYAIPHQPDRSNSAWTAREAEEVG